MNLEKLRKHCLSFPAATEQIQWGNDLVFKVGGKMFAVAATEPEGHVLSFKCTDEGFAELLEQDGIVPAPYMARAKWVSLERFDALGDREIQDRIAEAYRLVFAKLTRREQAAIAGSEDPALQSVKRRSSVKRQRPVKQSRRRAKTPR
jgi:predicted DNA-binding protein (MmcQ/YjbR family)